MLGNDTLRKPLQVSGRGWARVGATAGQMSRERVSNDGGDDGKLSAADHHRLYHPHQ